MQTAQREFEEETGIKRKDIKIMTAWGSCDTDYTYNRRGADVHKTTTVWCAQVKPGVDWDRHSKLFFKHEIKSCKWVTMAQTQRYLGRKYNEQLQWANNLILQNFD